MFLHLRFVVEQFAVVFALMPLTVLSCQCRGSEGGVGRPLTRGQWVNISLPIPCADSVIEEVLHTDALYECVPEWVNSKAVP